MTFAGPVDLTGILDGLFGALVVLLGLLVLAILAVVTVSILIGGSALALIERLRRRDDTAAEEEPDEAELA